MDHSNLENVPVLSEPEGCILLSKRDYAQFVAALDSPKPPTLALQSALAEYQRLKAVYPEANL